MRHRGDAFSTVRCFSSQLAAAAGVGL